MQRFFNYSVANLKKRAVIALDDSSLESVSVVSLFGLVDHSS